MPASEISRVLLGKTRSAVLRLLLSQPDRSFKVSRIIEAIGAGHGSVQRELKLLVSAGVIERRAEGREVFYQASRKSPVLEAMSVLALRRRPGIKIQSTAPRIRVPRARLTRFCRRHHIRKLAFFGSVLRADFSENSDVDVLVEFEPGHVPGFKMVSMEEELSAMLGRKVDLRTAGDLSRHFRDQVVREAKVAYDARTG